MARTAATIRREAEASGCRVTSIRRSAAGRIDATIACPSIESAIVLLNVRAARDARDPLWRKLGQAIRARCSSELEVARGVHAWAGHRATWHREIGEVFAEPRSTLALGIGDCDDLAVFVYVLAVGAGLRSRLRILRSPDGEPRHVCAEVFAAGRWWWAETSVPAKLGEHPISAARRRGATHRTGIK